jgi:hypothetical protein
MLSSTTLRPPASPAPAHLTICSSPAAWRRAPTAAAVRAVRNYDSIPKREPFSSSRSILHEFLRQDKPLIQRTKDQITGTLLGGPTALASLLRDLFCFSDCSFMRVMRCPATGWCSLDLFIVLYPS